MSQLNVSVSCCGQVGLSQSSDSCMKRAAWSEMMARLKQRVGFALDEERIYLGHKNSHAFSKGHIMK